MSWEGGRKYSSPSMVLEPWSDMVQWGTQRQAQQQIFMSANIQGRNTTKRQDKWALLRAHAQKHGVQVCAVQEAWGG